MEKLVLLGLDGADWRIINPLIEEGCLPNFKKVVENGSRSGLRSTIPPFTPPAWSSIFTGVNPGKHGIFDFFRVVEGERKFTSSRDIRVPYIWELMEKEKIIAFNIPTCYPPVKTDNTVMVCGLGTPSPLSRFTYPEKIKEEIMEVIPDYEVFLGVEGQGLDTGVISDRKKFSEKVMKNLKCKKQAAGYLLEKKEWDAAFIVFSAPDWMQHFFMNEFSNAETKSDTNIASVYKSIDEFLGHLINKEYNIIIVSDHGFAEVKTKFFLNTYLKKKGLLKTKKLPLYKRVLRKSGISKEFIRTTWPFTEIFNIVVNSKNIAKFGSRIIPTEKPKTEDIDYEKTVAFLASPNGPVEVKSEKDVELVKNVLVESRMLKDVFSKDEIYRGKAMDGIPHMMVVPRPDTLLKENIDSKIVEKIDPDKDKSGSHDEFGVFAACGHDFKKIKLNDVSVMDITPTILSYFSYSIPDYMDGKKIELFESSNMKSTLKQETKVFLRKLKS
jgi:predicted AlkP superfamily phosphohydrolase/phosphomutase